MKLSVEQFLGSVSNKNTRKGYRFGIRKFCEWYRKSPEEILEIRKDDLTLREGENIIEHKNRAARFQREIEKFHSNLLEKRYKANTARSVTLGIRQLFRYYEMPVRIRVGSKVSKTVQTTRNFPLRIEHVRAMFEVADLRERVILSAATDLGLRISDFLQIKKKDLPGLNQEAPISFDIMTGKEDVVAHGFLSSETVKLLKIYVPTLKKDNPYLFPSNSDRHISDEWLGQLLRKLAEEAQIDLNSKSLTFHCFRKMFLSAAIDSGIGLTAGKMLCGKSVPRSDATYLTTVKLREKFIQLKRFLRIKLEVKPSSHEKVEALKGAVIKLQEELTQQRTIAQTMTEENAELKERLAKLENTMQRRVMPFMKKIADMVNQKTEDVFDVLEEE